MEIADCYLLGYVTKLHGFKGEVSLFLDATDKSLYRDLKLFYVEINGNLTPFTINKLNIASEKNIFVKLEGIDDEVSAQMLLKKKIYLPLESLPQLSDTEFYDHEVIGFAVIDEVHGNIGILEDIIDLASNPLFQIKTKDGKEILIPLRKEFILELNRQKRELRLQTPEGLIDLYLE